MDAVVVRGIKVEPGTKVFSEVIVGELADGSPVRVPVIIVNGSKPGPSLLVTACLHGDEVVGTEAIKKVAASLDPKTLKGRFIGLPIINVPAYIINARVNLLEDPVGYNDLSRAIPTAQPNGSLTERIASFVRDEVYPLAETVIDIHSSAKGSINYARAIVAGPYTKLSPELRERIDRLAAACGLEYIFRPRASSWPGMYFAPRSFLEETLGKASIVLETGNAPTIVDVDTIINGIKGIMADLGMTDAAKKPGKPTYLDRVMAIRANRGGIWHAGIGLADRVKKGQVIGTINGPDDKVIEEVKSTDDGIVIKVGTAAMVATGTRVCVLGVPYQN